LIESISVAAHTSLACNTRNVFNQLSSESSPPNATLTCHTIQILLVNYTVEFQSEYILERVRVALRV